MQQGCRECGIEGPSSNFGHQGAFFFGKFHLGGPFFSEIITSGGVFSEIFTSGRGCFWIFSAKGGLGRKNLNFSTHFGHKRAFLVGKIIKNWLFFTKNLTKFDKFWIFWKIKKFWPPSWRLCGPETRFCEKISKFWLKKSLFLCFSRKIWPNLIFFV